MEKILVVDNHEQTRTQVRQHLSQAGYDVIESSESKEALERISSDLPELVVVEAMMPRMNGFQICRHLQGTPQSDLVYIIMMTILPDIEKKMGGIEKGANEYITKPVNMPHLVNLVRKGMDIIVQKRAVVLDPLTKLYNKNFFQTYLAQENTRSQRYQRQVSLILGDLDGFKALNEQHSYEVGDAVLAEMGKIFRISCRRSDIPVRMENDKFAILLPETDLMGGLMLAERLCQSIREHEFKEAGSVTVSFGVATLSKSKEELLKQAETSLADAKQSGGNKVVSKN
jgi:diguanylate cyclase (GGDEF)-like protein